MWRSGWLGVLAVAAFALDATAQVREIGLEEAVRLSIEHAPELRMGRADVARAADEKAGAIGPVREVHAWTGASRWSQKYTRGRPQEEPVPAGTGTSTVRLPLPGRQ